ncbi:MAG: type II toxin-antitoxin system VapC family toxin [Planctomycetia bacterium]|nr:type II toxin-antitoxin system VapC family toxin [Planctomycetia bacterium]
MASADRTYVDPSALRSLYIHDDRSRRVCAWRRRLGGTLALTRHGYGEIVNSVSLAVFRGDVSREAAHVALEALDEDVEAGRLLLVDLLWRRTLDRAVGLSRLHTPHLGTRTLDVLHVAAAMTLEMTWFVTYDVRQARLAKKVGLKVVCP